MKIVDLIIILGGGYMIKNLKKYSIILLILFIFIINISSIYAQDTNTTNNDTLEVEEISVKPYTDLYNKINSSDDGSTIDLNESYRFDSTIDNSSFVDGVPISKDITIIGKNNASIDGNFLASGLNITSNCHVVLKNLIFKNGYSETSAGSILVGKNSSLLIENCTFDSNTAYNSNGGAIYGLDGTNIEIYGSDFNNNSALHVTDLPWDMFKCGMGSAICMRIGSSLKLYDSIFRNHNAYVTTILIITWDDVNINQSTLYVDNCLFENNTAYSNGAIYLDEFGIAEIKNSIFRKNNSTDMGGTIVFDASRYAIVENCTFEDNKGMYGGGVYIDTFDTHYNSTVDVANSTFTHNKAIKYGGAIYSRYCVTNITNCTFIENTAKLDGGALIQNTGLMNIVNSSFTKNTARNGGGLTIYSNKTTVSNSKFTGNTASNYGGAIKSGNNLINIEKCNFIENSAQNGGALVLSANANNVIGSSFVRNKASKTGGAIYSTSGSTKISDSTFNENSAKTGGALTLKANANTVVKSSFVKNKASTYGGAIYSTSGSTKISDSTFNENSAETGGALVLKANANTVIKSSFVKNQASKKGGAIYSTICDITSSECRYVQNSAPKASNVYGAFHAKVTKYVTSSKKVKLKIVLTSPWKMPVKQKIKIKLSKYSSKWLKTNAKGVLKITLPKNKKVTQKTLTIKMKEGICFIKKYFYKNPGKIKMAKKVKKHSKLKVNIANSKTKKPIKNTKFLVKVFTKKHFKKLNVKTNSKGILKINMKKFTKGKHKISFYFNNNEYYIDKKLSFKIL